jgi:hypothetical protein
VESNSNGFVILTPNNEVYYLDKSQNATQIYSGKTVTDLRANDTYLSMIVSESNTLNAYAYNLSTSSDIGLIRSDVSRICLGSDWIGSIVPDGRILMDLLDDESTLPDLTTSSGYDGSNHIFGSGSNVGVDVSAHSDSVMVLYV